MGLLNQDSRYCVALVLDSKGRELNDYFVGADKLPPRVPQCAHAGIFSAPPKMRAGSMRDLPLLPK